MWPVSAERPLVRRPGLKGAFAYPVKKLLRPFLRWYVEPLAAEQRAFNDAILKLDRRPVRGRRPGRRQRDEAARRALRRARGAAAPRRAARPG